MGDIHFTVPTLELATAALTQAIDKATELNVPLILNGDTLDSKSIIQGRVANRLIELLKSVEIPVYINTGNHDQLHEKSKESSLNFLKPYATVISEPTWINDLNAWIVPYHSDQSKLRQFLAKAKSGTLIMHQGIQGANMGHYLKDSSSLPKEEFANFRVIASHYHLRQDIKCGRPQKGAIGLFSYIGNPYSLTWGESGDGLKGYSILMDDGILEFVPTYLRRHIQLELTTENYLSRPIGIAKNDLLWIKVLGPRSELIKLDKKTVWPHGDYKLELIPTGEDKKLIKKAATAETTLDAIIDAAEETELQKSTLKQLWREVLNEI